MKLELWLTGKTSYDYIEEGMEVYGKRIKHYLPFETVVLPAAKSQHNTEWVKEQEGESVLKKLNKDDFLILLDERGKMYSSEKFAAYMESLMNRSPKRVILLIGGAYGFSEDVYKRANAQWSLSTMTVSHQLVRLFVLEQVYRAMTILNNEPYHHA